MASFFEFFAGGGMARLGLGSDWHCTFANDICPKKASTYINNFGSDEIVCGDIYNLTATDLPGHPDLVWGSFPCQDLSLAGNGAGLAGERSGTFNKLVSLLSELKRERRQPHTIVIENVIGSISSHEGKDFEAIVSSFVSLGYYVGPLIIDGVRFVPQSRPRLFIIATKATKKQLGKLLSKTSNPEWHSSRLISSIEALPDKLRKKCIWWNLPIPPKRTSVLIDLLDHESTEIPFLEKSELDKLIGLMSEANLDKLNQAKKSKTPIAGGLYKRIRLQKDGSKLQRAEVRFDGVAGCLRTPGGGSSRQTIVIAGNKKVKARLLTKKEAARLMGIPDDYVIPEKYNDAYHVFGDGLIVPAVSWIEQHLLSPINEIVKK